MSDSAQQPPSEGAFVDGDKTKLDGIEATATADQTSRNTINTLEPCSQEILKQVLQYRIRMLMEPLTLLLHLRQMKTSPQQTTVS